MNRTLALFLVPVLTGILSTPAEALLITIEPDAFVSGTNMTSLFDGVALNSYSVTRTAGDVPTYGSVYATSDLAHYEAPTGTKIFAHDTGSVWQNGSEALSCLFGPCTRSATIHGFHVMVVRFDSPTNFFDISTVWFSDPANIFALDASNNFLGSCTGFTPSCSGIGSISSHTPGGINITTLQMGHLDGNRSIQTIVVGGMSAGSAGLDRLSYASVPEPSSLMLLAVSFLFLPLYMRRSVPAIRRLVSYPIAADIGANPLDHFN